MIIMQAGKAADRHAHKQRLEITDGIAAFLGKNLCIAASLLCTWKARILFEQKL